MKSTARRPRPTSGYGVEIGRLVTSLSRTLRGDLGKLSGKSVGFIHFQRRTDHFVQGRRDFLILCSHNCGTQPCSVHHRRTSLEISLHTLQRLFSILLLGIYHIYLELNAVQAVEIKKTSPKMLPLLVPAYSEFPSVKMCSVWYYFDYTYPLMQY